MNSDFIYDDNKPMKTPSLNIFVLLFLLVFNSGNSQKRTAVLEYQNDHLIQNLGIGLVQIVNPKEKMVLYHDNKLSHIKTKQAEIGAHYIPLLNKPDYGILFFTCIEKNNSFYKIAISNNEYAYIKSSPDIIFYSWSDFLKDQVTGIESKDVKRNSPRTSINGKPINVSSWNSDDETEVLEVQNDWVKMKNITQYNQIFWLRWREGSTLKVYLNLLI